MVWLLVLAVPLLQFFLGVAVGMLVARWWR